MSTPPLSDDVLRETADTVARLGSKRAAADTLGISRSTLQHRLDLAEQRNITPAITVEFPDFVEDGDENEPIDEIIRRMSRNYARAKKAHDLRQWFPVKILSDLPIGILFVGDPHLDDPGCAWPILERHVEICRETEGLFGVNIGDSANHWGGRLIKKYADQDTSAKTGRRLIRWFLLESGVSWLVWLHGNHEHMGDAIPIIEEMNRAYGTRKVPMFDWEARFILQFPNGTEFRINCAHDFPGNSMWNPNHGPVKAARFGDRIDLLVCGHKHNWAVSQWELPDQGSTPLMVRTRGYKHMDDYAKKIGFYDQEEGQSILVVFDPSATTVAGRMTAFVDVEKGAEYLKYLRNSAPRARKKAG